jgi:hypothetical protein
MWVEVPHASMVQKKLTSSKEQKLISNYYFTLSAYHDIKNALPIHTAHNISSLTGATLFGST